MISGANGLVTSSNANATRESFEPSHGGSGGAASIWYRWIAPADGDLVVATGSTTDASLNSNFDTLLGVYTGSSLTALSVRGTNDDFALTSGQLWSRVAIEVVAGTSYLVAVDGWGGRTGQVKLSWAFTAVDNTIRPSEPRAVSVSALDGSAWINWSAPTTLGRGTINYTATVSPGGYSCSTVGLRCLVGGLTNGTTYSVTVTARNDAGEGPASNPPVSFVPNTSSGRPVATRAWGVDRIDQRALPLDGSISRPSAGRLASVYVIDTGVYAAHNELAGRVVAGRNTIEGATNPADASDCNGHGTHVAGTIAGQTLGVAPEATVIPVKVLDCYGSGSLAGVVAGIDWMVGHHVAGVPAVANLSLGGSTSTALNSAVARAVADGITVVVAAGNSAMDACSASPASEPSAITVGATDRYDSRASYSNFGRCVDIFAPGSAVLSAGIDGPTDEATLSGTSMASPHVAGVAALLLDLTPSATPTEIATRISSLATRDIVASPGTDSPNLLLYVGSDQSTPTAGPTTTTVASQPAPAAAPTTAAPATTVAPVTTVADATTLPSTSSTTALARDVRSAAFNASNVAQPEATIVRASVDKVLLRISNARGAVDVMVNGKVFLRTKKRVLLLKSKGIGAKRVTVRASRAG
jgi:subtilisin family serine protease